mgnify:CR=1 FL=1
MVGYVSGLQLAEKSRKLIASVSHCNSLEMAEVYDFEARCQADCGKRAVHNLVQL